MRTEISLGAFLLARRRTADPGALLSLSSRPRRRPGLRREEVAALAGVSVHYYARLEQGRHTSPSPRVLMGIASALHLDEVEQQHLFDLTRAGATPSGRESSAQSARPALLRVMEGLEATPAILHGRGGDVLAVNDAYRAVIADFASKPAAERNVSRWLFLDEESQRIFDDWPGVASAVVANLRRELGCFPSNGRLVSLTQELGRQSAAFRALWERHCVAAHFPTHKRILHPAEGMLEFDVEGMSPPADRGQVLYVFLPGDARTALAVRRLMTEWEPTGHRRGSGGRM